VHQYGSRWFGLPGLSVPLLLTFGWFIAGVWLVRRGRRPGRAVLGSFLVTEALFYLVHNLSGAFLKDLPAANPVLLVASVLGYLSAAVAVAYLVALARGRGPGPTWPSLDRPVGRT